MITWDQVVGTGRVLGIVSASLVPPAGVYVAMDGPIPASRAWTMAEFKPMAARQLVMNKQMLEKEKFEREIQLKEPLEPNTRVMTQQRLNQVNDELKEVEYLREELRKK